MNSEDHVQIIDHQHASISHRLQKEESAATLAASSYLQDCQDLTRLAASYVLHPVNAVQVYFPSMWPFSGISFEPEKDIVDLSGKVVLVTGGIEFPTKLHSCPILSQSQRQYWNWQGDTSTIGEAQPSKDFSCCPHRVESTRSSEVDHSSPWTRCQHRVPTAGLGIAQIGSRCSRKGQRFNKSLRHFDPQCWDHGRPTRQVRVWTRHPARHQSHWTLSADEALATYP